MADLFSKLFSRSSYALGSRFDREQTISEASGGDHLEESESGAEQGENDVEPRKLLQIERFATVALAFCLDHDRLFRDAFCFRLVWLQCSNEAKEFITARLKEFKPESEDAINFTSVIVRSSEANADEEWFVSVLEAAGLEKVAE